MSGSTGPTLQLGPWQTNTWLFSSKWVLLSVCLSVCPFLSLPVSTLIALGCLAQPLVEDGSSIEQRRELKDGT